MREQKRVLGHLIACLPPEIQSGLAWFPYGIFRGAINFNFNQGGLLLGRNHVNNPRAPGDVLALDCKEISKFLYRVKRKAPCLRMKTGSDQGWSRSGAVSRASGLKWRKEQCSGALKHKGVGNRKWRPSQDSK